MFSQVGPTQEFSPNPLSNIPRDIHTSNSIKKKKETCVWRKSELFWIMFSVHSDFSISGAPWSSPYKKVVPNHSKLGYHKKIRRKTLFTTPWGTYRYVVMPFCVKKCRCHLSKGHDGDLPQYDSQLYGSLRR